MFTCPNGFSKSLKAKSLSLKEVVTLDCEVIIKLMKLIIRHEIKLMSKMVLKVKG